MIIQGPDTGRIFNIKDDGGISFLDISVGEGRIFAIRGYGLYRTLSWWYSNKKHRYSNLSSINGRFPP